MSDLRNSKTLPADPKSLIAVAFNCLQEVGAMAPGQKRLEMLVEANTRMTMGLYLIILQDEGYFDEDDDLETAEDSKVA